MTLFLTVTITTQITRLQKKENLVHMLKQHTLTENILKETELGMARQNV